MLECPGVNLDNMDNKPDNEPLFDCEEFFVSRYPERQNTPFKTEIRARFAGKKIRRFAMSVTEAKEIGFDLVEQIRAHGTRSLSVNGITVLQATAKFRPRMDGASKSHRQKALQACNLLDGKHGRKRLELIGPEEIEELLKEHSDNSTTRATLFRYLRLFFRWAERFDLIRKSPMRAIDAPPSKPLRNILLPEEMERILDLDLPKWLRAVVLLGGFAGLRSEEMRRMRWEDIDTESGQIHVRPGVQKDTSGLGIDERIVDFTAPLDRRKKELLGNGNLVPEKIKWRHFDQERNSRIVTALKWEKWPKNCLRHSFATYHLGECKNPGLTAFQMGHTSPAMVQRVYAVPARMADWKAWWAL